MELTREVKNLARKQGVDAVGIASAESLSGAPEGYRPGDLLLDAKSVVVIIRHLPKAIFASTNLRVLINSSNIIEHKLNGIAHEIANLLEKHGFMALPVQPDIPVDMRGKQAFMGDFSHKHAAEAAGLGEIGNSTLLLTPDYGPRVRIISVITTAPLEPDKKLEQKVCRHCLTCVRECPVEAISKDGNLDKIKCVRRCMPYGVGSLVGFLREFVEADNKERRLQLVKDPRLLDFHQFLRIGRGINCANCLKSCPAGRAK